MKEDLTLNAGDYVQIAYAMTKVVPLLLYFSLSGLARGDDCPKSYKRHLAYSMMKKMLPSFSVKQAQALQPSTRGGYEAFVKKHKLPLEIVELEDGAAGLFLGPKTAKKTLVWFHGGGYNFPAGAPHWTMLWEFIQLAKKNGEDLRVMMLEYELSPHGQFPLQLKQAVAAIKYLLDSGLQPSQILVGGDSAGGNLSTALIGHLTHPHPDVQKVPLSSNLGGVILVSPWVSFTQERESWKVNSKRDALHVPLVRHWSDIFMGETPNNNWSQPAEAPTEWWKDVKVDNIAITAGEHEVLRDDIRVLAENMKTHIPEVEYVEGLGEAHDLIVMDKAFGWKDELVTEQFIHKWILARMNQK